MLLSGCGGNNDLGSCPAACSEPAAKRTGFDKATGFTTNRGFVDGKNDECCDICAIPNANGTGVGHNASYDWDYIVMDSMYVPQFCAGLDAGHDITVTNVPGSKCSSAVRSDFQVHGLWPNYYDGYPACCMKPEPLKPEDVEKWPI